MAWARKVVFQDVKVVFVRHGNVFVRVSPNRLCRISPEEGMNIGDSDIQKDVNEKAALRHTGTDSSKSEERTEVLTDTTDSDSQTITEDVPAIVDNRQSVGIQGRTGGKLNVNDRIPYKMRAMGNC